MVNRREVSETRIEGTPEKEMVIPMWKTKKAKYGWKDNKE